MNDNSDNIVTRRSRRTRPLGPPKTIDGHSFVGSFDGRGDDYAPRAPTHGQSVLVPPFGDALALPTAADKADGTEPPTVPTVPLYQRGTGGHESRSLEEIKQYDSKLDIEDSEQRASSRYSGTVGTVSQREGFLKRIRELPELDEEGARAIVGDAVKAGVSSLVVETLIKPLALALGVKEPAARKFWKDAENQIRGAAEIAKANEGPTIEERARLEREGKERRKREAKAEEIRLWNSCKDIAESLTLLADMEVLVHRLGVVGEGAAISANPKWHPLLFSPSPALTGLLSAVGGALFRLTIWCIA
jgi:hypothetical protein